MISQNNLVYVYLLLTTFLCTVAAVPFCTALYGVPDMASCNELLHGDDSPSGYTGIGNTDRRDHLFALPQTLRPPHTTDEQWDNKVNLPIIRATRLCKLALLPILSPITGISTDTSHYPPIAYAGDQIQTSCIHPVNQTPSGGHSLTGTNSRLLLVLYARNSDFDNKVRRKIAQDQHLIAIETEDGQIIPGLASEDDPDDAGSTTGPMALDLVAVT